MTQNRLDIYNRSTFQVNVTFGGTTARTVERKAYPGRTVKEKTVVLTMRYQELNGVTTLEVMHSP